MDWTARHPAHAPPSPQQVEAYIGSPLWGQMNAWLQESYGAVPHMAFSKCSGQPGWNVKYQKGGKSLCTLYPMVGFFIALVVVGAKEEAEASLAMPLCSGYTRALYAATPFSAGGRWLMMQVTDEDVLRDALRLIALRVKPNTGT